MNENLLIGSKVVVDYPWKWSCPNKNHSLQLRIKIKKTALFFGEEGIIVAVNFNSDKPLIVHLDSGMLVDLGCMDVTIPHQPKSKNR